MAQVEQSSNSYQKGHTHGRLTCLRKWWCGVIETGQGIFTLTTDSQEKSLRILGSVSPVWMGCRLSKLHCNHLVSWKPDTCTYVHYACLVLWRHLPHASLGVYNLYNRSLLSLCAYIILLTYVFCCRSSADFFPTPALTWLTQSSPTPQVL